MATLAHVLRPIARTFRPEAFPDLLVGLEGPDDAAVYRLTPDIAIVQTVDFFAPLVDDPYAFGAIAAANAASDVYAMGGEVLFALNVATFPESLPPETVSEIIRGGAEKIAEAGGVIAGGHTVYDPEPKYGLCVTGVVRPDAVISKAGAQSRDALVITKAVGTGVVLTAAQNDRADEGDAAAAIESMLQLNRHASHVAREAGVHAMTDVTGFGLLGHASEVGERSGVRVAIEAAKVPLLPGARRHAEAGISTGGTARNREGLASKVRIEGEVPPDLVELLYDPQTSGGLLIALPTEHAGPLVRRMVADGYAAAVIGRIEAGDGVVVR